MAGSSKAKYSPEILANLDKKVFAEKLVGYIMFRNTPNFIVKKDKRKLAHAFDYDAETTVGYIEDILNKDNDTSGEMLSLNNSCLSDYRRFASEESLKCPSENFDAIIFLIFCVTISKRAALFYNFGIWKAPELAVNQIKLILENYNMANDGWVALHKFAANVVNMLRINEQIPKKTHSGENKLLDLMQREIRRYKSMNPSLNEAHIVLTENPESTKLSNVNQTSISTNTMSIKGNLPSDEKSAANYTSLISDENILVNNSEPNEKLVSGTPDSNEVCVAKKRKVDSCSQTENNADSKNIPQTKNIPS